MQPHIPQQMPGHGPYAAPPPPPPPPQALGHPHMPPHIPLPLGAQSVPPRLQHPAVAQPTTVSSGQPAASGNLPPSVYAAQHNMLLSLDDEDMFGAVDELDSISARDISTLRYARHHEWMEQILGSAYQSDKIIAPGLYAARGKAATDIWEGADKLKQRVAKMEEELNTVDEFYTRNLVEIKEMKSRAYAQMREAMEKQEAETAHEINAEEEKIEESSQAHQSLAIS